MINPHPTLVTALLLELVKLRADLRKADQDNIKLQQDLEWHKGRHEMLEAARKK